MYKTQIVVKHRGVEHTHDVEFPSDIHEAIKISGEREVYDDYMMNIKTAIAGKFWNQHEREATGKPAKGRSATWRK